MNLDEQIKERRRIAKLESEGKTPVAPRASGVVSDTSALIIPIDRIEVGEQARKTFDGLEDLAKTIKENSQFHPIVVKKLENGNYFLIDGERRYRAVKDILGEKTIAAKVVERNLDALDIRVAQIIANSQRKSVHPLELAREVADLKKEYKFTDQKLGDMVGFDGSWVAKLRKLDAAPDDIKERIRKGSLSVSVFFSNRKLILEKKSRSVFVKIPIANALEVVQLLQGICEETESLEPIKITKRPRKEELMKIICERTPEVVAYFQGKRK